MAVSKRLDKTKTIKDGYRPIYANGAYTMASLEHNVESMKNLHGFCSCNNLPSGRIAKLQGGYYILSDENTWDFIERTLGWITFGQLYDRLSKLTHPTKGKIYGENPIDKEFSLFDF